MRRSYTITLEDKTYFLLKRLSKERDIAMSHLVEKAILEKYQKEKEINKNENLSER